MSQLNHIGFPGLGLQFEIDPVAIEIFGFQVRWYGILICLGVIVATIFAWRRCRTVGITFDDILDILIFCLPSAIIGCRLYYVLFYDFDYYMQHPLEIITGITDGGLAFYGGLIAAVLVGLIVMKVKKINIPATLDLCLTMFLIAQAIGRWGNFVNGEAFGGPTDLPWRMSVYTPYTAQAGVHPTFLYESLWCLVGFVLLYLHLSHRRFNGENALLYLLWYGLGRAFIEGLRTDSLYMDLFGLHLRVSQVLSVCMVLVAAVLLIVIPLVRKKRAVEAGLEYVPIVSAADTETWPGGAADGEDASEKDASEEVGSPAQEEAAAEEAPADPAQTPGETATEPGGQQDAGDAPVGEAVPSPQEDAAEAAPDMPAAPEDGAAPETALAEDEEEK